MINSIYTRYFKNIAIYLLIAIFFIGDRYLKHLAVNDVFSPPKEIIANLFSLKFTANYQMAFSLPFQGWLLDLIVITVTTLLLIAIIYLATKKERDRINIILLTIILFGAISNLTDRLSLGYVIDYLDVQYFTVFNLADVMISVGAIIVIIRNLKKKYV